MTLPIITLYELQAARDEFAAAFGRELADAVTHWAGFCNSSNISRVAPEGRAFLKDAFRKVATGEMRLPSYRPPAGRERTNLSSFGTVRQHDVRTIPWK